jgi:hypothetical protein
MSGGVLPPARVRRAEIEDLPAIERLFAATLDADRPPERWRWRYRSPDGPPAIQFVLDDGGEVVGHIGMQSIRTWIGGQSGLAMCPGDTVIAQRHRGRGGFGQLVNATMTHIDDHDIRIAFPKEAVSHMAVHQGLGEVVGRVPQWIRWRTPSAMDRGRARPLPPGMGRIVHGLLRQLPRVLRRRSTVLVRRIGDLPGGLEDLVGRSKSFAPFVRVRDERYLRWRWLAQPDRHCDVWEARGDDQQLAGFAVTTTADLPRGKTCRIVDLLAVDQPTTTALLGTIAADADRRDVDVVTFEYADPRPWARRACLAAGFVDRGEGPMFLALRAADRCRSAPAGWPAWYLTFGDTDLV